jgi:hypothetical protein
MSSDKISVFVRVRPLSEVDGTEILPGLNTKTAISSGAPSSVAIEANENASAVSGFTGVIGSEVTNREVFETCLSSRMSTVLKGGTASTMCYGYSGAGKTHTMIGKGEETGMYQLATERLLGELAQVNGEDGPLFVQASACEIIGDNVSDLLGPEKVDCTLNKDANGVWQLCGQTVSSNLDTSENGIPTAESIPEHLRDLIVAPKNTMTLRGTFVTRSQNLRTTDIKTVADLSAISKTCVQQRAPGSAEQTNNSHAILKMEVVNQAILDARTKVEETSAKIPARKNAVDNHTISFWHQFYDGTELCLRERNSYDMMQVQGDYTSTVGTWKIAGDESPATNSIDAKTECALEGRCDGAQKTIGEWEKVLAEEYKQQLAAAPTEGAAAVSPAPFKLFKSYRQKQREFAGASAEKVKELEAVMEAKKAVLEAALATAETEHKAAVEELAAVMKRGQETYKSQAADGSPVGGMLVFVDLAAAESNRAGTVKKTPQQRREGMIINRSLLALKECFSSLALPADTAGQKRSRIRDSKITRILEDMLTPLASSSRADKETVCALLVNISPSAALERGTLNALRYGQVHAYTASAAGGKRASKLRGEIAAAAEAAERGDGDGKTAGTAGTPPSKSKPWRTKGGASKMDPAVAKKQLMGIYKIHCPEKTEADVDMLLSKCVGRERILIKKVRVKYLSQGQEVSPLVEVLPGPEGTTAIPGPVGTAAVGGNQEAVP